MKKTLRNSKTLSRSIITPFQPIQNCQETASSQNMYSSLCDDVVRRLQIQVDLLRRQFLVDREQRTSDTINMHQKVAELSKENIQRFDSLRDIFTQIESNIDQRLVLRQRKIEEIENSRMAVQSNIDFLFKKTWELDTSISEILNRQDQIQPSLNGAIDLQAMIHDTKYEIDCIKRYLDKSNDTPIKPSNQNFNLRLQGIEEEVKQLIYRYQPLFKSQQMMYKIEDDSISINRILKQHQDQINSLNFKEQTKLEEVYAYIDEQWEKKIESKLSRIINSYNVNFQELQETNLEIKDILQQIINVNGNLSHKLLSVINTKVDISSFKEAISCLNNQFTQTLTLNHQKINQIRDKQYQVEHELRSLKQILDRHDLDRTGARSVQKDIDEILSHREKDQPFIVSPRHTERKKQKAGMSYRTKSNLEERQVADD